MSRVSASLVCLIAIVLQGCHLFAVSPTDASKKTKDYGRPLAPGEVALEKVTDRSLYPDFGAGFYGERESLVKALDGTIAYFDKPSSKQWFPYLDIDHARARRSLIAFKEALLAASSAEDLNQRIVDGFEVYRSKGYDGSGDMLFTGYCQPIYDASPTKTGPYQYPLYRLPKELVKDPYGTPLGWDDGSGMRPSPTRKEFDNGYLNGRGLEMYYMKDRLEAFVVHVQGSAKLRLPDGSLKAIGYAGKTEHEYVGLGQTLVEEGEIPRGGLSLFAIQEYFAKNPQSLEEYLQKNSSYVFFTETAGGPYGSLNIEVTPFRTLATDKKIYEHQGRIYTIFPRGGVVFVRTQAPSAGGGKQQPFEQFLLDQDTGGAIKSAGRGDIFMGTGPEAVSLAGSTYSEGRAWYLYAR